MFHANVRNFLYRMPRKSALPLLLASAALVLQTVTAEDPDSLLNVTQIITRWGYPVENYEVITPDGYILRKFNL